MEGLESFLPCSGLDWHSSLSYGVCCVGGGSEGKRRGPWSMLLNQIEKPKCLVGLGSCMSILSQLEDTRLHLVNLTSCSCQLKTMQMCDWSSDVCSSDLLVVVQLLSHVWLFVTPWTATCQASLSFTNSQNLLKLMSIESVMPSNYLILCCPLLLPPSIFPSIRVFSNESAFRMRWPKYWSQEPLSCQYRSASMAPVGGHLLD